MINICYTTRDGYTTNTQGYRAPEFNTVDWDNSYIIQGCSAVFGLGIPAATDTISNRLAQLLHSPVINLGIPGAGMELQYMNTIELLEAKIKPRGVFIVYPSLDRYVTMNDGVLENIGPWVTDTKKIEWMMHDNSKHHNVYDLRAHRLMWELSRIPLYTCTHHGSNGAHTDIVLDKFLDFGDDGQHWGPKTAEHIATLLYKQVPQ